MLYFFKLLVYRVNYLFLRVCILTKYKYNFNIYNKWIEYQKKGKSMRLATMIIAFGASLLPSKIIQMSFMTSLIVSTVVYYVVYKIVTNMIEI